MKDGRDLNPIQIIVHEMTMTEEYLFRPTLQLKSLYIFLQWLHQQDRTYILKLILRWEWERES